MNLRNFGLDEVTNLHIQTVLPEESNVEILTKTTEIFEMNGSLTITGYKEMTGLANNYSAIYESSATAEWDQYYFAHFVEFERLLVETCDMAEKVISYKKDKEEISQIKEILEGFRDYYYKDGICNDLLSGIIYDYIDEGVITESQAEEIKDNIFGACALIQKLLVKYANRIIKILENHELPCFYRDYPYGEVKTSF